MKNRNRRVLFLIFVLFNIIIGQNYAQITTSKSDVSCHGCTDGSASVSVSGGTPPYEYKWSNGGTGSSISGLAPGTYSVFVTDANKCTGSASVTINDKPEPPDPFTIPVFAGGDPNDITGPGGYGEPKWVSVNDVLPYTIRFENDPKIATSAVNKVIVTHPIDKMANMFTFRLGNITFRNFTVDVPANSSHFFKRLNLVDSIGVYLDITAGIDVTKGQAFWIFQAFDPVTGLPNIDPKLGFLLINDSITHNGEGSVSFSIKPKITAKTGDSIKAYADIVFDINASIRTNIAFNKIDAHAPVSKVTSITSVNQGNIKIAWAGLDDIGGSGIGQYKLLVSTNNEPYIDYATGLSDSSVVFNVKNGNKYKIQTIANDHVKNMEALKTEPDTTIEIVPNDFFISPRFSSKSCVGAQFTIQWNKISGIDVINLQVSADSGKTYSTIAYNLFVLDSVFIWKIPSSFIGNKYYLIRAINSTNKLPFAVSDYFLIKSKISVYAGKDRELCPGESTELGGFPTAANGIAPYIYRWAPSIGLDNSNISNPFASGPGNYVVSVTDSLGCSNSDTVTITNHALPSISIAGLDSVYYINSVKDTLYGSPEGGIFSGTGITGNIFDPAMAGAGTHAITYTYTNEYGCSANTVNHVIVLPLSNAAIQGLDSSYCVNALPDTLTGIPAGGVFSGVGISGNIFNPSETGAGIHEIKYRYVGNNGDTIETIAKTVVYALPLVNFSGLSLNYCLNHLPDTLTGVPNGGLFSGQGITNNVFNPAIAGAGGHTIIYTFTDTHGCSNSSSQSIIVFANPVANFSGLNAQYCVGADSALLIGTPAGGIFTGNGVFGNTFKPSIAGIGSHSITYSYIDENGCSGSQTQTVIVNAMPTASFSGLSTQYCNKDVSVALTGSPSGGTFTGDGVAGNIFNPSIAGVGTHTITYSYFDVNGCSGSQTQTITVNALPVVSFSGLNAQYCFGADSVVLNGSPLGGIFSGDGVSENNFKTSIAGLGAHQVTYSYTDVNGCSGSQTQTVNVNAPPTVSFSGLNAQYCKMDVSVTLVGTPSGGTFTGDGVAGNVFNPSIAGVGIHSIIYSYVDVNGCSGSQTQTVTVNALPIVSFSGLNAQYCFDTDSVVLSGSPLGGIFSGDGITNNKFVPSAAGLGTHQITYTYSDPDGCTNSQTQTVTISNSLLVSFSGLNAQYCDGADSVVLMGTPSGGLFTGDGILGSIFKPRMAGVGIHTITYSYTDVNGCSGAQTKNVTIVAKPVVSFSGLNAQYCDGADSVALTGTPSGGVFTGDGILGSIFKPRMAGVGIHTITYSYTDVNGCSGTQTKSVTIVAKPVVSFSGLNAQYCDGADSVVLMGTPSGGVFTGDGIFGNIFKPRIAGVGTHSITYSYTDVNGCSGAQTKSVTIVAKPVVSFSGLNAQYCDGADSVVLMGTPSGGVFTGDGIIGSIFKPRMAGVGIHTITYSYTDVNGCSGAQTKSVTIVAKPVVSFSGLNAQYCDGADSVALTGTPSGGVFTGDGIFGNIFKPRMAGVGTHSITYSYTNANGCSGKQTKSVTVIAVPSVSFSGLANEYLITDPAVTLIGNPTGGIFSGDGMSNNIFSPSIAGLGSHTIIYTYSSGGCTNSYSQTTVVKTANVFAVTIIATNPACNGDCNGSATAKVTGGSGRYRYIWRVSGSHFAVQSGQTITNLCAGMVTVYVTDLKTHKTVSNFAILTDPPLLKVVLSYNNTAKPNCNNNCNGKASVDENQSGGMPPYTFAWFKKTNGKYIKINNETSSAIDHLCKGNYKIAVTDKNNCYDERLFTIKCVTDNTKSLPELADSKNSIVLYPNPASSSVTLELHLTDDSEGRINILDMLGAQIKEVKKGMLTNEKLEVDVSTLSRGMYYVQVVLEDDVIIEKLIVK